jgi:hypothetical protein
MHKVHTARIHWSAEQLRQGLPSSGRRTDPAWFTEPGPGSEEGWSLVCEFEPQSLSPDEPTIARVSFMVENAPHDRLRAGTRLQLFEQATRRRVLVEILD